MSVFTVRLPPTKTYRHREASLVRLRVYPLFGVLEVRESRSPGLKVKASRYAVREQTSDKTGQRVFRLTKPGGAEWHFACIGLPHDSCECEWGQKGLPCKHTQSLRALWSAGHLDHQPEEEACYNS